MENSTIRKLKKAATRRQSKAAHRAALSDASDIDILDRAISDITSALLATPSQSKESAANALAMLMRTQREINPPSCEELAAIAYQQGIRPEDFAAAVMRRRLDKV